MRGEARRDAVRRACYRRYFMDTGDPSSKAATILLVDDFADNRQMYAEFLTYSGFTVIEAADGAEAIAKAIECRPDVVIMDLSLPVIDGWEATRRLKSDPRTSRIPVIALTGHTLEGYLRSAREAGCDRLLAKPSLPDELLAAVKEILASAP
jgi:two-component system cell cycle response regulator DivK